MGLSHPAFLCITIKTMRQRTRLVIFLISLTVAAGTGCYRDSSEDGHRLQKVVLQTDWFAQPEHGGFYQALANGYYEEEGLDVEILQGGPNAMSTQKVIKGTVDFAMHRADAICQMASRDIDVKMVMATLQHDPQGIMLHDANPVKSFADLDGRKVMAVPGLSWIRWIEAKYSIRMEIIPHDFGLQRFLNDPEFIQQCLLTNEPYYVKMAGASPRILQLRDSGFDPCHGIYCLTNLIKENPDLVRRFVRASIRGWKDFILNDPSPALEDIASRNPKMNPEFMEFCYRALQDGNLVTGDDASGTGVGTLDHERMRYLEKEMRSLGLLPVAPGTRLDWYTTEFLPKPSDGQGNGLP